MGWILAIEGIDLSRYINLQTIHVDISVVDITLMM